MHSVLAAEAAVLFELDTIGIVLLVLEGVVVSLLALGAGQTDLNAHDVYPPVGIAYQNKPRSGHLQ